ncbi:hypothetical protein BGZ47_009165 [Haplosporangium gracile]|nr:hypothetical protein BGZ47_009165 [Haplosporangium gracile]
MDDGAMSGSGVEEVREEVHIRHGQEETNSAVASSATPDATLTASFELKGQPTLLKSEQSDQGTEPVWARDHYNTIPTTMPEPNQQQQQQYPPQEVEIPYLSFTRDRINTNVSATAAAIKPSPPSIYIRPDVQLNDEKAADEDEDIILQEGKRLVRFDNWVSTLDDACSTAAHTTVYTSEKMTSAIVISKTRPMTRLNSLFIRRRTKRSDMAAGEADTASRKL